VGGTPAPLEIMHINVASRNIFFFFSSEGNNYGGCVKFVMSFRFKG
jgi:hypothetical protein